MDIKRYVSNMLESNMYMIREADDVMIIDPSLELKLDFKISTLTILLTHEHYDHICATNYWKNNYNGYVMCSKICSENIKNPKKNFSRHFIAYSQLQTWIKNPCINNIDENFICEADSIISDGVRFEWENHIIEPFYLPGHSPGGMGYLIDNEYFFSGDNILPGYATEFRLPYGSKDDWYNISKPVLDTLDNSIKVFPGHFDPITIEEWRAYN